MKLMTSAVTFSAAIIKSPSFSRSASSTMMIILPSRTAVTASSMRANGEADAFAIANFFTLLLAISSRNLSTHQSAIRNPQSSVRNSVRDFPRPERVQRQPGQFRGADHILADHVAFQVDAVADFHPADVRVLHRVGHDHDVDAVDAEAGDRQADTVDGDRPLMDDERR